MSITSKLTLAAALAALLAAGPALADSVVYQSASYVNYGLGEPGDYFIDSGTFYAAEFTVGETTQVSSVGGVFTINSSGDPMFAAIVAATPGSGTPNMSSVLGTALLTPLGDGSDQTTALSVSLAPGSYDLVFGFGLFGSPVNSTGPFGGGASSGLVNGQSTIGSPLIFVSSDGGSTWSSSGITDVRMDVNAVPVPAGLPLLLSGLLGLGGFLRRRAGAAQA